MQLNQVVREICDSIALVFLSDKPKGVILGGIVGCGKTTAITSYLKSKNNTKQVFIFSGDNAHFRAMVETNTNYLLNEVEAKTQSKSIIFVDEVQKCPEVFDALKIAFDAGHSFLVSGSNPSYLSTQARKRLQRRADFFVLSPFSLPEILYHKGLIANYKISPFMDFIEDGANNKFKQLTLSEEISAANHRFFQIGGFPLAHLAKSNRSAMEETRLVVERGFELLRLDTQDLRDQIMISLAKNSSQEFSYQGIFKKTGTRSRESINIVIDALVDHGYLVEKKPVFPGDNRRSYLSVFSYVDPGILSYLTGNLGEGSNDGFRIESYIHARLKFILQFIPFKNELSYFKPFTVDANEKTKFLGGEIDFVITQGQKILPIEVKANSSFANIDTKILEAFVKKYHCDLGVVLYGGVAKFDQKRKIQFWPYWLV